MLGVNFLKYTFYFDESFHDRKIKLNSNGTLNTMVDNALDSYIGVFWGAENEKIDYIVNMLTEFENKFKNQFGLSEEKELKSEIIGKKNYRKGVATFNKTTFDFYFDLFNIIKDVKPILQMEILSKTECMLRELFNNHIFCSKYNVIDKSFFYSLTKFINVYHNEELLTCLFNVSNYTSCKRLKEQLLYNFECVLSAIGGIKRKEKEYIAIHNLYEVLSDSILVCDSKDEFKFSYEPNFSGLCLLLQELQISPRDVSLIIDKEEKTFEAANQFGFNSIEQIDSKTSIQIRLSDLLSGFVGRMIYSLQNDEKMVEDKINKIEDVNKTDIARKRILDSKWFNINEKQFNLYLLIYNALIIGHEHYWTVMTTTNGDHAIMFFGLLRYFANFESFNDYSLIEPVNHAEYYNNSILFELENFFKTF